MDSQESGPGRAIKPPKAADVGVVNVDDPILGSLSKIRLQVGLEVNRDVTSEDARPIPRDVLPLPRGASISVTGDQELGFVLAVLTTINVLHHHHDVVGGFLVVHDPCLEELLGPNVLGSFTDPGLVHVLGKPKSGARGDLSNLLGVAPLDD